jgi:hypothetical protein
MPLRPKDLTVAKEERCSPSRTNTVFTDSFKLTGSMKKGAEAMGLPGAQQD